MSTICIGIAACNPSATDTLSPAQTEKSFTLDYEKFTLDNGLEVVLHVDKSDPIVALTTVVHVGSNREKTGRTGFAHFFEHMAFNDSENVPRGWNRKAIPDWGGSRNGGTWSDGTIYYEVVPKDAFDKILWIDSDRLGYMINTVTQSALDKEKQVVKNEKRQRVDNAAYGYTQEVIRKALYPEGHPYSWTVIGALPDLQAATLEDLREFYDQYYGAANATLAIAGDIDIAETKAKVKQWFGEIRRGEDVMKMAPMPVNLDASKSLYFEDNFAKLPELRITYPSVESYHGDELALEILGQIMGGTKKSPLYTVIVEQQKLAPNVSSYNNSMELAGEFVVRVRANAGVDLDDVKSAIEQAFADFEDKGVDPLDLKRIIAEQETSLYGRVSTILGKSNQLATDNEFAGDPSYTTEYAKKIQSITPDDVVRVYNRYVKDKPAIYTSFVPKGQADLALQGAELASVWIEDVKSGVANEDVSEGEVAEYEKTPTKFDRSEPDFGELPLVKMPEIWDKSLGEHAVLYGIENSETPLVAFSIAIDGGRWLESPEKNGMFSLLARLMNEGTANKTPAELEQAIGLLGSNISVSMSSDQLNISGATLSRNMEETIALVEEIMAEPRLTEAEFDKVKSAAITAIKGREANPNSIASLAFSKLLYGDDHPLGLPGSGSIATVEALSLEDMKAAYNTAIRGHMRIHVAGDISADRAAEAFQPIAKKFAADRDDMPSYDIPAQTLGGNVYFIDVPGSKQSVLNIGKLTVSSTHADANKINFTNEKLGGGISGDLAQTLRIGKGYTYGAYSWVTTGKEVQPFKISTSVRANVTGPSLEIIRDMVINYGPDFTDDHAEMIKKKLIKENTRAFESLNAKLGTLIDISKYGKSKNFVETEQQELVDMSVADFKNIAATYLAEPDMIYVVVGDKATQWEAVSEFADGKIVELDIYGNPK
ncbi:MAG: insulinase family protein [Hellea sp.]|nr:insulinase family protein [Hellea sp.]